MALVVDASIALAWGLPDESSAYADAVLAAVEREGLRVPDLWAREVANGLAMAYLRKRITSADEQVFLTALSHLRIDVEEQDSALTTIRDGTAAAKRYGLTAYDAAYVDLASREGLVLATLDKPSAKPPSDQALRFSAEKLLWRGFSTTFTIFCAFSCGILLNMTEETPRLLIDPVIQRPGKFRVTTADPANNSLSPNYGEMTEAEIRTLFAGKFSPSEIDAALMRVRVHARYKESDQTLCGKPGLAVDRWTETAAEITCPECREKIPTWDARELNAELDSALSQMMPPDRDRS